MASKNNENGNDSRSLRSRFPIVSRLEQRRKHRQVPYIQQNTAADCGAACLAMTLGWFGRRVRLDEVRDQVSIGRDGSNALTLIKVGREFGLRGRGISLEVADLDYLPPATILHWGFDHFVVYESADRKHVHLIDPALGRRRVTLDEFGRHFTGVALVFEQTESFVASDDKGNPLWKFLRRVLGRSGLLTRILTLSVLVQVIGLGLPVLTGLLVDRVIPHADIGLMEILVVGFAGLTVFQFLSSYVRSHLLIHLRTELDARMTLDFLEHLFDLPFAYFQIRSTGDLMMRLNSNATVREIITSSALSGALDGILVLSYLVLLTLVSPMLGGVVVVLGLLRVIIFLASRHRIRDLMTESLAKQARSQGYQVQMFTGIETLKAAGAEPRALEHWSHLFIDVLNVSIARGRLDALIQSLITALGFASPLVILLVGGHLVIQGHLSLGTMLALNALAAGFLTPLSSLVNTALQFQQLGSYIDRLEDVLATEKEQVADEVIVSPSLSGAIDLENVTFKYTKASPPAVSGVTIAIESGQLVAIVGRSAAGKTTMANLMLGLYRPTKGRILFDGHDLTSLEARSVRAQLGVVVQQTFLFGASIRDNIALADPTLSLAEVVKAARLAYIHDEIVAMPLGYNTILADSGMSLSGGQRQRIALARALARKPAILLLDEATSSLDTQTEKKIQHSLAAIGCTRIVVAHRLSTIRDADLILMLDRGELVESGTHAELMAKGGQYADLVSAQIE